MESSTAAFHIDKRRSRSFLSERARQHPEKQTQPLIRFELDEAALQHFCGCPTAHDESAHFFLSKTRPRTRHSANDNHQLQPATFWHNPNPQNLETGPCRQGLCSSERTSSSPVGSDFFFELLDEIMLSVGLLADAVTNLAFFHRATD